MNELDFLVDKAIHMIREAVREHGSFYIMFSGGKDSLVSLDLYLKAVGEEQIRGIVFVEMTGNTDGEAVKYVYNVTEKLGVHDKLIHLRLPYNMLDRIKRWGIPTPRRQWCWGEKFRLLRSNLKPPFNWVVGIKASDSPRRSSEKWNKYLVVLPDKGELALQPVIEWTNSQIYAYIEREGLPLNPCYKKLGSGGVCVFCPFRDKQSIARVMSDPYWGPRIEKVLSSIRSRRNAFVKQVIERWLGAKASPNATGG